MDENLFSGFDRVRVVNLPERKDRRKAMTRELRSLGFEPGEQTFFPAYKMEDAGPFPSPGAHGCFLSHAAVISEAAAEGESLLILEDDCVFRRAAAAFEVPPCDIFWGGWNEIADEGDFIIGAHCVGFSRPTIKLLDTYLRSFLTSPPDDKAVTEPNFDPNIRPGIDGVYVWFRRAYPRLETCFADIAYQRPSRSDITPTRLDASPVFRQLLGLMRRAKHAVLSSR